MIDVAKIKQTHGFLNHKVLEEKLNLGSLQWNPKNVFLAIQKGKKEAKNDEKNKRRCLVSDEESQ